MEQERADSQRSRGLMPQREKRAAKLDELEIPNGFGTFWGGKRLQQKSEGGARPAKNDVGGCAEGQAEATRTDWRCFDQRCSLKAVQAHSEGATPGELLNYLLRKFGMTRAAKPPWCRRCTPPP